MYPRMKFIEHWQKAANIVEFCRKTGMKEKAATQRAWRLRLQGIPLKEMSRRPSLAEQIKLAQQALLEGDNGTKV
jgi:hypothetical protein